MSDCYNKRYGLGSHSEPATLEAWWLCADNAATKAVVDESSNGRDMTLQGSNNTQDIDVTGPTSYLTKGLDYASDWSRANNTNIFADVLAANELTYAFWTANNNPAQTSTYLCQYSATNGGAPSDQKNLLAILYGYVTREYETFFDGGLIRNNVYTLGVGDTDWKCVVITFDGAGTNEIKSFINGVKDLDTTDNDNLVNHGTSNWDLGATNGGAGHSAKFAGFSLFSEALSDAESDEIYDGPELVNVTAPVMTGTETEGETLSVTTGTYALDAPFASGSNGTATYAYQWTRSDDSGGTGEVDIAGATNSTYTLTASDAGKFIRCLVTPINDGGYDPAEETASNMSGAITALAPEINVTHDASNVANGETTPIDFGSVVEGGTALTETFVVENTGMATLTISTVTLPSGYSLGIGNQVANGTTIAAASSKNLVAELPTGTVSTFSGDISLANDDSDENPYNWAITGEVTAAPAASECRPRFPRLSLNSRLRRRAATRL